MRRFRKLNQKHGVVFVALSIDHIICRRTASIVRWIFWASGRECPTAVGQRLWWVAGTEGVYSRCRTARLRVPQSRWYDQVFEVNIYSRTLFKLFLILKIQIFNRATSARFPNLTALYSIGKSAQGRDLWVIVVSASPYEHMIGKPDVKYIANIHGNEAVGKELMLHLVQYLVTSYATDPYIKWLLDNTRIHILPSLNPDGYAVSKEGTCDGAQGR